MLIKTIDYYSDSAQYFDMLAHLPWAVCLDSCQPYIKSQRFDILTAEPESIFVYQQNNTSLVSLSAKLAELALNITLPANAPTDLPFYGGAIGFVAYPSFAKKDIDLPAFAFGIYAWAIVVDHHKQQSYFVCCLDDDSALATYQWLKSILEAPLQNKSFKLTSAFTSNLTFDEYQQRLQKIANYIYEGECYQINLAQRFQAEYAGDIYAAYQHLRKNNPAPFSAYLHTPFADILSCSPERFIQVHNQQVETKPIKGTRPRSKDAVADQRYADELLHSEKDHAENLMIVDLMRNDLSKVCKPFSVKVPKLCALESFANVHHLVSTIHGELCDDKNAIDLLQACFPGGSITGTPKVRAMQIIEELEPHNRNIYCGSIAYIDIFGNMDSNIAIRTLLCKDNQVFVYGGGGIVADSDIKQEYQESINKVKNIIDLLGDM